MRMLFITATDKLLQTPLCVSHGYLSRNIVIVTTPYRQSIQGYSRGPVPQLLYRCCNIIISAFYIYKFFSEAMATCTKPCLPLCCYSLCLYRRTCVGFGPLTTWDILVQKGRPGSQVSPAHLL
ncbi:uncharacterized protein LOC5515840 isoform X1 [Nematostella vectensis]|uniref:uncharacterized protein LOC5515840 isoform X1 n=1 Tax=Nematostella vectensis TaxID=45351 RepID=UPI00207720CC|nr:uncharacterized protein LOC5515840 isoform X1 [Nematostella vectensis]